MNNNEFQTLPESAPPAAEKTLGIVRHVLTFFGGILIASGKADANLVALVTGAVITGIGGIWSIIDKINRK